MKLLKLKLIRACALLIIFGTAGAVIDVQAAVYPPNDECWEAAQIDDVTNLEFDTTGARFGGRGLCMVSPTIWYCYTAPCTGEVTVSLAGSSYDTMLAVYKGCECFPTQADFIACNDDFGGTYQSQITFSAIAGERYLFEVGGYGSEEGPGLLTVRCEGEDQPPASKDDCENARSIGDVTDMAFDTTDASFDGPGLCMISPNIWFKYAATCSGDVTVSLLTSQYDTMLAVYDGTECNPTTADLIECNDDAENSYQSKITFTAIADKEYLIEIGGYASETGHGVLNINCEGAVIEAKPDLGDAPDRTNNLGNNMRAYAQPWVAANFPTVYNDGQNNTPQGPAHINSQVIAYLGEQITAETEADSGPDEDGRNNINPGSYSDRDGGDDSVEIPLSLPDCGWITIDYDVTVVEEGTDLWVNVWLDFNRDGDWDDTVDCDAGPAAEWAVQNQFLFNLPEGKSTITSPAFRSAHPEGTNEDIWMRITLSDQPWTGGSNLSRPGNAGSGPPDKYQFGETEDYFFTPEKTSGEDCPLCEDVNKDGVIDIEDLIVHITQWLATCQQ